VQCKNNPVKYKQNIGNNLHPKHFNFGISSLQLHVPKVSHWLNHIINRYIIPLSILHTCIYTIKKMLNYVKIYLFKQTDIILKKLDICLKVAMMMKISVFRLEMKENYFTYM